MIPIMLVLVFGKFYITSNKVNNIGLLKNKEWVEFP